MRHLALVCPRCGAEGKVRIDELDLQFRCKSCRSLFHVDQAGQCRLGAAVRRSEVAFETGQPITTDPFAPFAPLAAWLARLPRSARLALVGLVICGAALGLFLAFGPRSVPPIPDDLEARAEYVARAVVENNAADVTTLAASGTSKPLREWLRDRRPSYWGPEVRGDQFEYQTQVVFQDAKKGSACVVVALRRKALDAAEDTPAPATSPAPSLAPARTLKTAATPKKPPAPSVDFLLFWTLDGNGQWLLDGQRMARSS
jgi:hypothetical protein